jgi:serine/threonine protein phosphatase PrpC
VKEYTSISELTNVSLYAIIESVGMDPACKDYIYRNLHEKISKNAKELGLDQSTTFYETLATVIYKAYDELDMEFMNMYPKKRKYSGAKVLMYLIVGNKLFCVNLGDMQGHLIMASKLKKTNTKHSIVSFYPQFVYLSKIRKINTRRPESRESAPETATKGVHS